MAGDLDVARRIAALQLLAEEVLEELSCVGAHAAIFKDSRCPACGRCFGSRVRAMHHGQHSAPRCRTWLLEHFHERRRPYRVGEAGNKKRCDGIEIVDEFLCSWRRSDVAIVAGGHNDTWAIGGCVGGALDGRCEEAVHADVLRPASLRALPNALSLQIHSIHRSSSKSMWMDGNKRCTPLKNDKPRRALSRALRATVNTRNTPSRLPAIL